MESPSTKSSPTIGEGSPSYATVEPPALAQRARGGFGLNSLDQLRLWERFHVRLTVWYGGTVLLTLVTMGVVTYQLGVRAELDGLRQRLLAVVGTLSATLDADAIAALPLDTPELTPLQQGLRQQFAAISQSDPDIETIYVFRPTEEPTKLKFVVDYVQHGKAGVPGELFPAADLPVLFQGFDRPVVEDRPYEDEFGLSLSGYAPLRSADGHVVGLVGADVQVSRLEQMQQRVWSVTAALFGVALGLVALGSWLVARSIRAPLKLMISATTAIASGALDTRVGFARRDEFGVLGSNFDAMADELRERQFIRDTFGRYVSEDVARTLLANRENLSLGGEERLVTILFADLRNYTSIAEVLSPTQMVAMLNTYFGAMNEVLDAHHGCVIEFLGDAILAVFGAPQYLSEHAEQAVNCALAMRQRLDSLNVAWEQTGLAQLWHAAGVPRIDMRVGIHTGPVVTGNLGSKTRMKYAVIGDSVNVAARLETLNKELDSSILLSGEVRSRLSQDVAVLTQDRGEIPIKGRSQTVRVFSI
jgi:adenylate cyclase